MNARVSLAGIASVSALSTAAGVPPTNIDPAEKHAWGDNIGFLNAAGAEGGARGLHVSTSTLAGWIWSQNVGWICVGDGTPENTRYANQSSDDYGVNIDPATGSLSGLAWGENIGWIRFGAFADLVASGQAARADFEERRLRGYAWGENIGWISFDSDEFPVRFCLSDLNSDGLSDLADFLQFFNWYDQENAAADVNHDGMTNLADFLWFFNASDAGCP